MNFSLGLLPVALILIAAVAEAQYGQAGYNNNNNQYPQNGYNNQYPQSGYNNQYPQTGYNNQYPQTGYNNQYPQTGYNNNQYGQNNNNGQHGNNNGQYGNNREKIGSCPPNNSVGACVFDPNRNCLNDYQCPQMQKCCSDGCNKVCKHPIFY